MLTAHGIEVLIALGLLTGVYALALRLPPANLFELEGLPADVLERLLRRRRLRALVLGAVFAVLALVVGLAGALGLSPWGTPPDHFLGAGLLLVLSAAAAWDQWRCPVCHGALLVPGGTVSVVEATCPHCRTPLGTRT